jgi:hypothetical protein
MAYVARYGHQPYTELLSMTIRELTRFQRELSDIVHEENEPRKE